MNNRIAWRRKRDYSAQAPLDHRGRTNTNSSNPITRKLAIDFLLGPILSFVLSDLLNLDNKIVNLGITKADRYACHALRRKSKAHATAA